MHRIYLDWASSTPVHPKVAQAIYYAMEDMRGNPSSSHEEGRKALEAVTHARREIAQALSIKPDEIVFTSGGTESNNLAVRGLIAALQERGIAYGAMHAITSTTEHSSVLEAFKHIESLGVDVTYLNPSFDGLIDPEAVFEALRPETVLVSIAHVNSETGVIMPISDIRRAMQRWRERGLSVLKTSVPECSFPVLHTDAAQSPMYLESGPHVLGAALVSYDAQKLMGPKGTGILYRDFSVPLSPIMGGGTQERGVRPGTENVHGIIGAGIAFTLARANREAREKRVRELRDYLIVQVTKAVPQAKLIGHPRRRIANNAFFAIPGIDGDYLSVVMDKEGVAVSPRSACTGSGGGYSHVVLALTGDMDLSRGTIRFSLGPDTEEKDIHEAVKALVRSLAVAKQIV